MNRKSAMRQAATSRGDHHDKGMRLRFWAAGAALAAAGAGLALMVATGGPGNANASVVDPADLSLTKSGSPDPVGENALLTYTLDVNNAGPDSATNVVVSDDLPSQVDPVSADPSEGNCEIQGKKVHCELGTLANRASATVMIEVTPKKAGLITNEAEVESEVEDPQPANNRDTEDTTVTEGPEAATCKKKAATIEGTDTGEILTGTEGRDVILAGGGADEINAGGGKDLVCAGDGNDLTRSGGGNDFAKGEGGSDTAKGQSGSDTLKGNRGGDDLKGGRGNDLLAGGKGVDRCAGGAGSDTLRNCNP
jgi:uncharacterized repeat protein (TIGR01451 family)